MIHYPRITLKEKQTWPTASTINQENNVLLGAKRINICGVHLGLLPQTSPGGFRLQVIPERGFLFFWIFLLFFSELSFLGRVWTEFGNKIFFLLSRPTSSHFGLKIMLEWSFLIFWIYLLFFSEFSCTGRVWTEFRSKIFLSLSRPI